MHWTSISVASLDSRRTPVVVDCLPLWETDMPDAVIHSTRSFHPARRRRRPRLGAAILALVACLCARTASADAVALTGRVTDSHGGVVAGADVRVRRDDGTVSRRTASDATGTFTIAALPAGDYVVEIEKPGFRADVAIVNVAGAGSRDAPCRARRRRRARVGGRHRLGAAAVDARDVEGGQRDRRGGDHGAQRRDARRRGAPDARRPGARRRRSRPARHAPHPRPALGCRGGPRRWRAAPRRGVDAGRHHRLLLEPRRRRLRSRRGAARIGVVALRHQRGRRGHQHRHPRGRPAAQRRAAGVRIARPQPRPRHDRRHARRRPRGLLGRRAALAGARRRGRRRSRAQRRWAGQCPRPARRRRRASASASTDRTIASRSTRARPPAACRPPTSRTPRSSTRLRSRSRSSSAPTPASRSRSATRRSSPAATIRTTTAPRTS